MTLNSFKKVNNGTKYLQGIQLFTYSLGNANIGKCWRYPVNKGYSKEDAKIEKG